MDMGVGGNVVGVKYKKYQIRRRKYLNKKKAHNFGPKLKVRNSCLFYLVCLCHWYLDMKKEKTIL